MTSSGPDAPLTELCAICHINELKYTCPRCGIHTCSLPCVKKHKVWAQCSGIRNPAAFKKHSELATASSIDQDYNFITKVERSIQRADDDLLDKEINLAPAGVFRPYHTVKSKFDVELEANNTTVVRAPKGLSRSKQNKSRWDQKKHCIVWTIEFVLPTGTKLVANCQAGKTITEACRVIVGNKVKSKKRPRDDEAQQQSPEQQTTTNGTDAQPSGVTPHLDEPVDPKLNFYLQRSNVQSNIRCLIPVSRTATISDVLRNQTVLEFPTIYILYESPDDLEHPFITETSYLKKHGSELPVSLPTYGAAKLEEGEVEESPASLDSKEVLEVLRQDVTG